MKAPTSLDIAQRTMFIDAVIAKQIVRELLDSEAFGRVGLGLGQALAQEPGIHKAQGSEFPAVVIPIAMQHYMLLQRNLIYTGITRAKRLLVVVGQKKALGLAVRNDQSRKRYSGLLSSLKETGR